MIYEGHLTIFPVRSGDKFRVEGWGLHYSEIHGDPDLGKGVRAYATFHREANLALSDVIVDLEKYFDYLVESGVKVIRRKIEVVMYDRR